MERKIKLASHDQARVVLGTNDQNLKLITRLFKVKAVLRGEFLKISGTQNNIARAQEHIDSLLRNSATVSLGAPENMPYISREKDRYLCRHAPGMSWARFSRNLRPQSPKVIGPKTKGQKDYAEAIRKEDIIFGIGPAGTGKTYLAMAAAVEALREQKVRRIILTRPAIEAGESLGYLPGDMFEKISPYLRPLYDALYDMMDAGRIEKYLETGIIEVAPLGFMRGRTLNDAFIVLDEAQNATAEQMKMFLTRLGFDSKAVITGDITQSDLPGGKPQGLLQAMEILNDIEGIKFIYFSGADVVRHELVQKIIEAYEKTIKQ